MESWLNVFFKIVYRGVEELGRPRRSHKSEIVGSNPTPATNTKRLSYNGIITAFQADDTGSIPVGRSKTVREI